MPVRSLHSSVMRWPPPAEIMAAAQQWAERLAAAEPSVLAVGCFGSYARGDFGFGSDLDLIVIVAGSGAPQRPLGGAWATESLPVPADLLAYSSAQWQTLAREGARFYRTISAEARWLFGSPPASGAP